MKFTFREMGVDAKHGNVCLLISQLIQVIKVSIIVFYVLQSLISFSLSCGLLQKDLLFINWKIRMILLLKHKLFEIFLLTCLIVIDLTGSKTRYVLTASLTIIEQHLLCFVYCSQANFISDLYPGLAHLKRNFPSVLVFRHNSSSHLILVVWPQSTFLQSLQHHYPTWVWFGWQWPFAFSSLIQAVSPTQSLTLCVLAATRSRIASKIDPSVTNTLALPQNLGL